MQNCISKFILILGFIFIVINKGITQENLTLVEKLGYPKNTKLLIIHTDDIGMSHSENQASITALEKGMVNSGSVLVPCPWFPEIAAYFQKKSNLDLGIHLALTSEWKYYKWKPVLPINQVPSLVNEQGFFYDNSQEVAQKANIREVEAELTAQVLRAMEFGLHPTHLDTHMGAVYGSKALFEVYLRLGRKFKLPLLITKEIYTQLPEYAKLLTNQDIVIDQIAGASPDDFKNGMEKHYAQVLRSLGAGVTEIIIHTAFDDAEMQAITIEHPDWGATWRQKDFDFFTSPTCKKILEEEKIQLITWKKIGELLKK